MAELINNVRAVKAHTGKIVGVDEKERTITSIITNDEVDSDKEVVLAKGLDFKRHEKNPVVFFMHDAMKAPVAKCVWQKLSRNHKERVAKTQMAETEFAEELFQLYLGDFLRGFSIGMDPGTMKIREIEEADVRKRKEWAGAKRIIESASVIEYSLVTIPANEDALTLAYSKGLIKHTAKHLPRPAPPVRIETVNVRAVETIRIATPEVKPKRYTQAESDAYIKRRLDFVRGLT